MKSNANWASAASITAGEHDYGSPDELRSSGSHVAVGKQMIVLLADSPVG
jgi:hypothetical protein